MRERNLTLRRGIGVNLRLFRRHTSTCVVERSAYKNKKNVIHLCECPIWVEGSMPGLKVPRQSTGMTDWEMAQKYREDLLKRARSQHTNSAGYTIAECIETYIEAQEQEVKAKTLNHHQLALDRFHAFCGRREIVYMSQLNVDLIETFKVSGWPKSIKKASSKATLFNKVLAFLKEAFRRGWLKEMLSERVRPIKVSVEQKEPYEEDEVDRILDGALKLSRGVDRFAAHPPTFRLLLELMLETGMRVSDAVWYDARTAVKSGKVWAYTYIPIKSRKTEKQKPIDAFISDRLKKAIDKCTWLADDRPFRYMSDLDKLDQLCNEIRSHMRVIGERCEVKDCRPHRLRDTFAIRHLLRGTALEDVSRLLGHSSVKVTELYYAKWVQRRKDRLRDIAAQALMDPSGDSVGDK
jgi:integrase